MSYQKRYDDAYNKFIDAGGGGQFHPPERNAFELSSRIITTDEHIAIQLLNCSPLVFPSGEALTLVKNITDDTTYVVPYYPPKPDRATEIYCNLANAIIRHRLCGIDEGKIQLGELNIITSLAAEIVRFHTAIIYLMQSKEADNG